jgi:hypothetical protein
MLSQSKNGSQPTNWLEKILINQTKRIHIMPNIPEIGQEIIQVALQFVNLHEVKSNAKWDNPDDDQADELGAQLLKMMQETGWQTGWPYCAAFCEAVWRTAYKNLDAPKNVIKEIATKLTPSVMGSYKNWQSHIKREAQPGAIFFMQKGDSGNGHAGIIVKPGVVWFSSIEGNTSPDPQSAEQDREGDGIFKRSRKMDFTRKSSALWLRGFLNPIKF